MKLSLLSNQSFIAISAAAVFIVAVGCEPSASAIKKPASPSAHDHDGHDHAHDHSHDHGPNGGHLVDLSPSDMHAEWTHDDESGKITLFFTDSLKAGKKVDSAMIDLLVAGQEPKSYEFKANDKGNFELQSLELLTAIELCSGEPDSKVSAKLVASIDGKMESAPIEHHEHGHSH